MLLWRKLFFLKHVAPEHYFFDIDFWLWYYKTMLCTDISLTRTLAQRIFGTSTVEINTKDQSTPVIRLENIAHSVEVKRMLSNLIEKEREAKKVVGRDMYGAVGHLDDVEYDG